VTSGCSPDPGRKRRHPAVDYRSNPFEIALCGPSGSGKTTLAAALIRALAVSHRVGYLKHASHSFSMDTPGKDTWHAAEAGAVAVHIATGDAQAAITAAAAEKFDLSPHLLAADLVVVEGYKDSPLPKIVVLDADGRAAAELAAGAFTNVRLCCGPSAERPVALPESIDYCSRDDVDTVAAAVQNTFVAALEGAPLNGLVLTGGRSTRMATDKAAIAYHGVSQTQYCYDLLTRHCDVVYVSCRSDQTHDADKAELQQLPDRFLDLGPLSGILTAMHREPTASWLVLACDLPFVGDPVIEQLLAQRNPYRAATAFASATDGFPEPLCAVYEPKCRHFLHHFLALGYQCPRKVLINAPIALLPAAGDALANANHPGERAAAEEALTAGAAQQTP
jgi:molybdopterin-guanine dinucleotide biosynthesis protein MobB